MIITIIGIRGQGRDLTVSFSAQAQEGLCCESSTYVHSKARYATTCLICYYLDGGNCLICLFREGMRPVSQIVKPLPKERHLMRVVAERND